MEWEKAYDELLPVLTEGLSPVQRPSNFEAFRKWLVTTIEELIAKDMESLMFLLYRIDVNEQLVKAQLAEARGENAALIIADLILERQLKKIESRKKYSQPPPGDEAERW